MGSGSHIQELELLFCQGHRFGVAVRFELFQLLAEVVVGIAQIATGVPGAYRCTRNVNNGLGGFVHLLLLVVQSIGGIVGGIGKFCGFIGCVVKFFAVLGDTGAGSERHLASLVKLILAAFHRVLSDHSSSLCHSPASCKHFRHIAVV